MGLAQCPDCFMRILVADDDPLIRKLLQDELRKLNHEVTVAENGEQAWAQFEKSPFPIVVTDWDMPWPDGLELCKRVRAHPQRTYTYFIIVSSVYTLRSHFHQAMDGGVDDVINKPFEPRDLFVRLRVAERIVTYYSQLQELKLLIPICMYCRKIRDDQNYWQEIESYLRTHMSGDFSHGICPTCYETRVKPEIKAMEADYTQE